MKTIRDRLLKAGNNTSRLLGLYQQILPPQTSGGKSSYPPLDKGGQGGVPADDSPEQMELRLSGLVVKQQGNLRVYNRIYETVFNHTWVEKELANLRPSSEAIALRSPYNRANQLAFLS